MALVGSLTQHPFFRGMTMADLQLIAACGARKSFAAGDYLGREGHSADHFYLILRGQVSIEIYFPERGALRLQTLSDGDIAGWSWLFPPYRWRFDLRAQTSVDTIALDGCRLRAECDRDPRLGYDLMQRFAAIMTDRLQATRLQLVDLYSHHAGAGS